MREFGFLLVLGGLSFAIVAKVIFLLFEGFLDEAAPGIAQACIGLGGAVSMGGLVLYAYLSRDPSAPIRSAVTSVAV